MANGTTARSDLNRAKFAGFDFDTHVDDLRARIQIKFAADYNDFALSSLGMMLLDIIAFGLDSLSFYLDRRATETYLSTARTRRGVSRLSRQLGYKMGGAVASSTDLDIAITTPKAINITIPQGFQFDGPNGLIFEAAKDVTWTPLEQSSGTVKQVPVSEGETFTETFTSDGTANQVFELTRVPEGKFVTAGTVETTVDGADWEEVEFLEFESTDQFEIGFNDDPATIRFGDGSAGNIPATGASIKVSYLATSGKAGNVAAGTITEETTALVVAGDTIGLSITHAKKTGGGDDPESLEHTKAFAGKVFNSRRVAITANDYRALAGSFADPVFGRVAVAQAISSRTAAGDLSLVSLLNEIEDALSPNVDTIRDEISSKLTASGSNIEVLTDELNDNGTLKDRLDAIGSSVTSIEASVDATITGIRGNRNTAIDMRADVDAIRTSINSVFTVGGSDTITAGTKASLLALLTSLDSSSNTIEGAADTQVGQLGSVKDEIDKIGTSVTAVQPSGDDSFLKDADESRSTSFTAVGEFDSGNPAAATGLAKSYGVTLKAVADALDPTLVNNDAATVANALSDIFDHVDKILSDECKANLVTVPILVRDSAGFYTAPSNGLINSLSNFLEARKEVTQTIEVVSGGGFLVFPKISVRVGVLKGFSLEQTRTAVETAIDGVLRDRAFGKDLFISDLMAVIGKVEGVAFANVVIDGYITTTVTTVATDRLDDSGNLIIDDSEVITKGTEDGNGIPLVNVTPEAFLSTTS